MFKSVDSETLNGGNNPANVCKVVVSHCASAPQPLGFKELINCWKSKDITAAGATATVPERTDNLRSIVSGCQPSSIPCFFHLILVHFQT